MDTQYGTGTGAGSLLGETWSYHDIPDCFHTVRENLDHTLFTTLEPSIHDISDSVSDIIVRKFIQNVSQLMRIYDSIFKVSKEGSPAQRNCFLETLRWMEVNMTDITSKTLHYNFEHIDPLTDRHWLLICDRIQWVTDRTSSMILDSP